MKTLNLLKVSLVIGFAVVAVGCTEPQPPVTDADSASPAGLSTGDAESHHAMEVTEDSFHQVIADNEVVLVDFWATWCGPCLKMGPAVESVAEKMKGKAVVAKLDVDKAKEIAVEYEANAIPLLVFFKNGEEHSRLVGLQTEDKLLETLNGILEE